MKKILLTTMLIPVLFLGGCQTLSEWKSKLFASLNLNTLYKLFEYVPNPNIDSGAMKVKTNNIQITNHDENKCPKVEIMRNLGYMAQFMNPYEPNDKEKISDITIENYTSNCEFEKPNVVVDITLDFKGNVGKKGRLKKTDKPNFAYPYFIAVTDNHGEIVSKDIFAITMSYKSKENNKNHIEKIRQTIPLEKKYLAQNYKIIIGFQLSDEELNYNRELKHNASYMENEDHQFVRLVK